MLFKPTEKLINSKLVVDVKMRGIASENVRKYIGNPDIGHIAKRIKKVFQKSDL